MAYSRTQIPTLGSTGPFAVPFKYINKSHVKVTILGLSVAFTWLTPTTIQLLSAPPGGSVLEIRRETPIGDPLVTFVAGPTPASGLNLVTQQVSFALQEAQDRFDGTMAGLDTSAAVAARDAAQGYAVSALGSASAASTSASNAAASASTVASALVPYTKTDGSKPFTAPIEIPRGGLRPGGGPSFYESPEQAVRTTAGPYGPFTHGASVPAVLVRSFARCVVADLGYSVGDEVEVPKFFVNNSYGITGWSSATQIGGTQGGNVLNLWDKTTGASAVCAAASWRIVLRAYWL